MLANLITDKVINLKGGKTMLLVSYYYKTPCVYFLEAAILSANTFIQ